MSLMLLLASFDKVKTNHGCYYVLLYQTKYILALVQTLLRL